MLASDCALDRLLVRRQHSRSPCVANTTYGCTIDGQGVWVTQGCRARFELANPTGSSSSLWMDCGVSGVSRRIVQSCPLPRNESDNAAAAGDIEQCVCFESGLRGLGDALYECGTPDGPLACVGDARGTEKASRCCARAPSGCALGFRTCAWRADDRIAWLHPVKSGTSFLIALARLANSSLPENATLGNADRYGGTAWGRFLHAYKPTSWFRGSDIWWHDGMAHAAVTDATYHEFRGRFFGMFRDPRERGWSAYNYFVGDAAERQLWPPTRYAACIRGLVTGALTGQPRSADRAFGTVPCHLPPRSSTRRSASGTLALDPNGQCGCEPFEPDVARAKVRVAEGFAFTGLVEEWALSMCLFALKFNVRCVPALFANARPTRTHVLGRVPPSVYRNSSHLFGVFADDADAELYRFVRVRFVAEARRLGVTRARCAAEVCPQARQHFL